MDLVSHFFQEEGLNTPAEASLGVVPTLAEHPLPQLLDEGLLITINSDDPPMFDTTLTDEYLRIVETFDFDLPRIKPLVLNGIRASLLPIDAQRSLEIEFKSLFMKLENDLGL